MFYDALTLRAFAAEVGERYPLPWFIQKFSQLDEHDYLLSCRWTGSGTSTDRNLRWLISLRPGQPGWSLWRGEKPPARVPSSFTMLCRKHLQGRSLLSLEVLYPERAVRFTSHEHSLILELLERQPNLLLLDDTGHIRGGHKLGRGKRSGSEEERDLRVRQPYVPPLRGPEPVASKLGLIDLREAQASEGWPLNLLDRSFGLSPAACRRLSDQPEQLWDSWKALWASSEPGGYHAERLENGRLSIWGEGPPRALLTLEAPAQARLPGLEARRSQLLKSLQQKRQRLEVRLRKLTEDRSRVSEADDLQREGELLLTYQHQVPRGAHRVQLLDWDGVTSREIALDPSLPVLLQARRRLKRAAKFRRSLPIVERREEETRRELAHLADAEFQARQADSAVDLSEIAPAPTPSGKDPLAPRSGPRRYRFQGYQILVGRTPKQNDQLVQRFSKREDLWFHVKDSPGAHVVLKTAGRSPEPEVVEAAAVLAARYSSRARDSQVLVSFTSARRVKKPAGSPAGFVIYSEELTLWVRPEFRPPGLTREEGSA